MISLQKNAGFQVDLDDEGKLIFGEGVRLVEPKSREFSHMRNYLRDPSSTFYRSEVYDIYRDVARLDDLEKIREAGLEYDLTVLFPGRIGEEFSKTIGHYHPLKPNTGVRYPEVYEVLYGQLALLLQKGSEDLLRVEEVYLVEANRGEKIVVPPGYGHVSVNLSEDFLVISNWQALGNQGIYEPYEAHNGAAYYVSETKQLSSSGKARPGVEYLPNLSFPSVPPLKKVTPRELPHFDLLSAVPMYFSSLRDLSKIEFLTSPEDYLKELIPEKLYK